MDSVLRLSLRVPLSRSEGFARGRIWGSGDDDDDAGVVDLRRWEWGRALGPGSPCCLVERRCLFSGDAVHWPFDMLLVGPSPGYPSEASKKSRAGSVRGIRVSVEGAPAVEARSPKRMSSRRRLCFHVGGGWRGSRRLEW